MAWKVRSLSRLTVLSATVLLAGDMTAGPTPATAPASPPAAESLETAALLRPQTRIRKLHLVRPDLIPYPLAYEVLC
jgi:hypothetical protein